MKYMLVALFAVGLLGSGFAHAKVEDTKKTHVIKKKSVYKKTAKPHAKSTKIQAKKAQSHKIKPKPKKQVYKNVTKRAVNPAEKPAVATPKATEPVATPKTTEETAYQKFTKWIGLGAGAGTSAAAAKQALIGHHRAAGYHIGPRDWHHNFPSWWANRGWTSADVDGVWYFGGHPIEWWASKPEYASYYKNVIRPTFLKAHPEKR